MFVVEVVLGVVAVLAVALVLAAVGGGLPSAPPDSDDPSLPRDRLMTSEDVGTLRFRTAVRGYRMEDVDAAMTALHAALLHAETKDDPTAADEAGQAGAETEQAGATE